MSSVLNEQDKGDSPEFDCPIRYTKDKYNISPLGLFLLGEYQQLPPEAKKKVTLTDEGFIQLQDFMTYTNPYTDEVPDENPYNDIEQLSGLTATRFTALLKNPKYHLTKFSPGVLTSFKSAYIFEHKEGSFERKRGTTYILPFGLIVDLLKNKLFSSTYVYDAESWTGLNVRQTVAQTIGVDIRKKKYNSTVSTHRWQELQLYLEKCYATIPLDLPILKNSLALIQIELVILEQYLQVPYLWVSLGMVKHINELRHVNSVFGNLLGENKSNEFTDNVEIEQYQRLTILFEYMQFLRRIKVKIENQLKSQHPLTRTDEVLLENKEPITNPHLIFAKMWIEDQTTVKKEDRLRDVEMWNELQPAFNIDKSLYNFNTAITTSNRFDYFEIVSKVKLAAKNKVNFFNIYDIIAVPTLQAVIKQKAIPYKSKITGASVEKMILYRYDSSKPWRKRYGQKMLWRSSAGTEGIVGINTTIVDDHDIKIEIDKDMFFGVSDTYFYTIDKITFKIEHGGWDTTTKEEITKGFKNKRQAFRNPLKSTTRKKELPPQQLKPFSSVPLAVSPQGPLQQSTLATGPGQAIFNTANARMFDQTSLPQQAMREPQVPTPIQAPINSNRIPLTRQPLNAATPPFQRQTIVNQPAGAGGTVKSNKKLFGGAGVFGEVSSRAGDDSLGGSDLFGGDTLVDSNKKLFGGAGVFGEVSSRAGDDSLGGSDLFGSDNLVDSNKKLFGGAGVFGGVNSGAVDDLFGGAGVVGEVSSGAGDDFIWQ